MEILIQVKIIFLMQMAIDLASICIYLKAKVFVIKEPYFMYSDAIQLIANKIGIKTLAYQYSNLGYFSPLMVASSDIFLLPGITEVSTGRAETQGIVILEAQSMELPVLVSDAGGMKYGVNNNHTGYVIAESCINSFVEKILLLK